METDAVEFRRRVSINEVGPQDFALIPVFDGASADDVVARWMNAPRSNWLSIKRAFELRYETLRLQHELQQETQFARELITALEKEMKSVTGLAAFRIERVIPKITFPESPDK